MPRTVTPVVVASYKHPTSSACRITAYPQRLQRSHLLRQTSSRRHRHSEEGRGNPAFFAFGAQARRCDGRWRYGFGYRHSRKSAPVKGRKPIARRCDGPFIEKETRRRTDKAKRHFLIFPTILLCFIFTLFLPSYTVPCPSLHPRPFPTCRFFPLFLSVAKEGGAGGDGKMVLL